ncbi:hypothetical protein DYB25_011097 [Aphanomyces astaci]|uniref:Apple domain-containing protein n=1 Tax=Aphanomyces astaci TaxID=112090 RepID=A0A397C1F3_APHAT|nr:hypothetical protein DYB34_008860 [Aphanomyces astaci]RHY36471.1 hypothetical protein DYB25_011097 [Aphanomyces astaci]RHY68282.1 hypothetical protein DYB30_010099 [Aphanomyces astaci]RHZ16258.1 hypothetical protein DYB31_006745 [Aphanomyces astaci]
MKAAVVSLMAAVAVAQSACPGLEYNVDYDGYDITYTDRATPAECTADCESTPGCKLFVWYQNRCWLKSFEGSKKTSSPDRVSCVLTQPVTASPTCAGLEYNVDYEGNDIGTTSRDSADECVADCIHTRGCNVFVWYWNTCWLKSAAGHKRYLQDRIACALTAPAPQPTLVCPAVYYNVDYEGHDIGATSRESADECVTDCQNTPGCKLFVWFQGQCWLKSQKGNTHYLPGRNSCVLEASTPSTATCRGLEANVDYAGYDISYTDRTSPADCTADCQKTPGCKLFVWFQNQCWLKNQLGERRELSDRVACILTTSSSDAPTTTTTTSAAPTTTTSVPDYQDDDENTDAPSTTTTTTTTLKPTTTITTTTTVDAPTTTPAPRPSSEPIKPLETGPRGTAAPAGTLEPWDSQGTPAPTTDIPDPEEYTEPPAAPTTTTLKPLETGPRGTAAPAGTLEPWDSQGTPAPTTDIPDPDEYLDITVSNLSVQKEVTSVVGLLVAGVAVVAFVLVMKRRRAAAAPMSAAPMAERKRLLQV